MKGWLGIGVVVTLFGVVLGLTTCKPSFSSAPTVSTSASAIKASEDHVERLFEQHLSLPLLQDPLSQRQAYYLKRWVIRCARQHAPLVAAPDMRWEDTASIQATCAYALIDQYLQEPDMVAALAQGMKSLGMILPAPFDTTPAVWPSNLKQSWMARRWIDALSA